MYKRQCDDSDQRVLEISTRNYQQMKYFHIYLNDKCLFKNLNQEEFDVIWGRIYRSYFRDELTYVECIDDACIQGKIEEHSY